jgi:signal peptidase I
MKAERRLSIPGHRFPHAAQASPLVLRNPVIRSPCFHCPRFLSSSRRSNRLRTFLLPPRVAAARRLRCCDISKSSFLLVLYHSPPGTNVLSIMARLKAPLRILTALDSALPGHNVREMSNPAPPALPKAQADPRSKLLIWLCVIAAAIVLALCILRVLNLVRPFSVPTGGMNPAVSAGDHVVMEGFTYLWRKPRRGDVVVFRTTGISGLPQDQLYIKRVVGEPGEHLRIAAGELFINGARVALSNSCGEIVFLSPTYHPAGIITEQKVPSGNFFVIGDNTTNSYDSRFWGPLPARNIIGRIDFCYWPSNRRGLVH